MTKIGEKIKAIRRKHDLNQQEFADSIGALQNNVSQWEKGKVKPSLSVGLRICEKYKIPIGDLYGNGKFVDKDAVIVENEHLREQVKLLNDVIRLMKEEKKK